MLHDNKDEFIKVLERTSAQTGFPLGLLEKDYYITLLLSGINGLSDNLIFKGGTALSKIYYSYYRLSEDLDFSMKLPPGDISRTVRRNTMKPVKDKIKKFAEDFSMSIEGVEKASHNEAKQYIYAVDYKSVVSGRKQSIKLEIGLRFNPFLPASKQKVNHKFLHPFTRKPLFDGGTINCLALKELVAEKLRASSSRLAVAPRDFYDIGFLIKTGFDFRDKELLDLFRKKLAEDGLDDDLAKYRVHLGRTKNEIADMNRRIKAELLDVLPLAEQKTFSLQETLDALNGIFEDLN